MRSNCAASSLSNSGSKTTSFLGLGWLDEGANLDGWEADIGTPAVLVLLTDVTI
jgi:hypothetical protein